MQYTNVEKSYCGGIAFHKELGVVPHGNGEMTEPKPTADVKEAKDEGCDAEGSDADDVKSWDGEKRYYLGIPIRCRQRERSGYSCMCLFCEHTDYEGLPLSGRKKVCLCAKGRTLNIKKTRGQGRLLCTPQCVEKDNEILDGEDIITVNDSRFVEYDGKTTTIFCGGWTYKNTDKANVFNLEGSADHDDVPISFTLRWELHSEGLPF